MAAEKAAAEKKAGEKQVPQPYLSDAKYTTDEFRTSGTAASPLLHSECPALIVVMV